MPCIVLLLGLTMALPAKTEVPGTLGQQKTSLFGNFGAGVNISWYEHYWQKPTAILGKSIADKYALAQRMGLKTVRLPVAFDLFLLSDKKTLHPQLLQRLKTAQTYFQAQGMNLVIVYHYGQLYKLADKKAEARRIAAMWQQVIDLFRGVQYGALVFELYNEPRIAVEEWNTLAPYLFSLVRAKDPFRYWIIGSTDYNGVSAFERLQPLNDARVMYTFHFYEPYMFTHQGAAWDKAKTAITQLPYPYQQQKMPALPAKPLHPDLEYNYFNYNQVASRAYMSSRLDKIVHWSKKFNKLVLCTESGVIESIPVQYRENYLYDMTTLMREKQIPYMIWDLDQSFSIKGLFEKHGAPQR